MEYPGRVIIIGRDATGEHDIVVYAITGRSPASQARRMIWDGHATVRTEVTDAPQMKNGDERLLLYNCLRAFPEGLAVSNGAQTDLVCQAAERLSGEPSFPPAVEILRQAFKRSVLIRGVDLSSYEPDGPVFTPRISGCLAQDAALAIVRRASDGSAQREFFQVPLEPGRGAVLTTYTGGDLSSFAGRPLDVGLCGKTAEDVCQAVHQALQPRASQKDLRVGVSVVF